MKVGMLTVPFSDMTLEKTAKYLSSLGVQAVELGTGGYTNACHCHPEELIQNPEKAKDIKNILEYYGLGISALSCHGNPVHPVKEEAERYHKIYEDTLQAAQMLGVDTVVTFSGCPGSDRYAQKPSWVTCAWPPVYQEELEYQWNECLLPYWEKTAKAAENAGVKIAIEMHPGFCVYNTETMLRLREEIGPVMGANFDPSHLFWQGMDATAAIRKLGKAIHYVHAKDCKVDEETVRKAGVLDTKNLGLVQERSWIFRTVGYGHDETTWKNIISQLKAIGYDGTISIEHEDALMSVKEGAEKAIEFLKKIIIREQNNGMWWI